jgi:hypothetical protein
MTFSLLITNTLESQSLGSILNISTAAGRRSGTMSHSGHRFIAAGRGLLSTVIIMIDSEPAQIVDKLDALDIVNVSNWASADHRTLDRSIGVGLGFGSYSDTWTSGFAVSNPGARC